MSANSSQDDGGESGVWLRVRILNSFVFSLRTTVRAIRDSLREADQSFSASLRSRSKHEGESSASLCDRLGRTREISQRQLPTDHDYAVPTREYQLDQSSPLPATAVADPVLEKTNTKTTPTIRRC